MSILIKGDILRSEIIWTQVIKGKILLTCFMTIEGFDLLNSVIKRTQDIMYSFTSYREINSVPEIEKAYIFVAGDII